MGSEIPDYYNKTLASENNTVATRNSGFPVWEDYKGSVDDLQYFLIGLYTFNCFTISLLLVQYILPLVCLTVSHTSVCRTISCGLSSQDSKLEENEMINLTLQPAKRSGPQAKLSHHPKWTYSFIRRHRRRYSKKTACVRPAPAGPALESREGRPPGKVGSMQSQPPPSNKFMPGVPTCFEVKPEENSDVPEMRVSRSIMRLRKRSRSVFYRLTVLILVFAVSWMPLHLFHVVTDFNDNLISNRHFKLVYCICHLLGMMSCCLNPILYGFLNNGIKADLMSLIHCLHVS